MLASLATWERYVPDLGDNRARHAAGAPALIVEIRPPTARTWRRFLLALTPADAPDVGIKPGTIYRALLDDTTADILWSECVGTVTCPPGLIGGVEAGELRDGACLWALRDRLAGMAGYSLYADVLNACLARATLEAGLADFLASASGPPPSSEAARPGIVPSADAAG